MFIYLCISLYLSICAYLCSQYISHSGFSRFSPLFKFILSVYPLIWQDNSLPLSLSVFTPSSCCFFISLSFSSFLFIFSRSLVFWSVFTSATLWQSQQPLLSGCFPFLLAIYSITASLKQSSQTLSRFPLKAFDAGICRPFCSFIEFLSWRPCWLDIGLTKSWVFTLSSVLSKYFLQLGKCPLKSFHFMFKYPAMAKGLPNLNDV